MHLLTPLPSDIPGDYEERPPRHAKAYRNFAAEHRRLQEERIAAFREYIGDVQEGRFPERGHLVEMEAPLFDEVVRSVGPMSPMRPMSPIPEEPPPR